MLVRGAVAGAVAVRSLWAAVACCRAGGVASEVCVEEALFRSRDCVPVGDDEVGRGVVFLDPDGVEPCEAPSVVTEGWSSLPESAVGVPVVSDPPEEPLVAAAPDGWTEEVGWPEDAGWAPASFAFAVGPDWPHVASAAGATPVPLVTEEPPPDPLSPRQLAEAPTVPRLVAAMTTTAPTKARPSARRG